MASLALDFFTAADILCVVKKEGEWELKNIFLKKNKHNKPQFKYFVEPASLRKRYKTLAAVKTYNMTHVDIWTRDPNGFFVNANVCNRNLKKKRGGSLNWSAAQGKKVMCLIYECLFIKPFI